MRSRLLDTLGIEKAHVVGNSLGGVVVWRLLMDYPARLLTATLVDTGSPFGFGGTKDVDGTPCYADFAGSGGGLSNPELIKRLAGQDRSMESPFSPRVALRTLLVKPPFIPAREEDLLTSMFTTHLGPQDNPGDFVRSANWPYVAPGLGRGQCPLAQVRGRRGPPLPGGAEGEGALGARQPRSGRGDTAARTWATWACWALFQAGRARKSIRLSPCWARPARPEKYAAAGGAYREVVIQDAGHVPFIEKPEEFNAVLHAPQVAEGCSLAGRTDHHTLG